MRKVRGALPCIIDIGSIAVSCAVTTLWPPVDRPPAKHRPINMSGSPINQGYFQLSYYHKVYIATKGVVMHDKNWAFDMPGNLEGARRTENQSEFCNRTYRS
jgi:hypothetical protein